MNIFFLSLDPKTCAQWHVDKHVVKMILETCQLLCSAHWLHPNIEYTPPYKLTHKNHPSAIWTRTSLSNYKWLCQLGLELCKEYTYRYEKHHKCEPYLEALSVNVPDIPEIGFTTPLLAMPDMYKDPKNPVDSYQTYVFFEKSHFLNWKKRDPPPFYFEFKKMFDDN